MKPVQAHLLIWQTVVIRDCSKVWPAGQSSALHLLMMVFIKQQIYQSLESLKIFFIMCMRVKSYIYMASISKSLNVHTPVRTYVDTLVVYTSIEPCKSMDILFISQTMFADCRRMWIQILSLEPCKSAESRFLSTDVYICRPCLWIGCGYTFCHFCII